MTLVRVSDPAPWLTGRWTIDRVINDGAGTFSGTADFCDDDAGGLHWREQGHLRLGARDGPARRALRLVPGDGPVWEVRFDDGRPFHELDLRSGRCAVTHLCGADAYRGEFTVCDEGRFTVRWRIDGPAKADVIVSDYRRIGDAPPAG